jgi:hypothetical protein
MAVREIASQTFQFVVELSHVVFWRSLIRLPWALVTSVAVLLAVAGPGQHLSNLHETSSVVQWFALILWLACFGVAGLLWGLHRAVYEGINDGIRLCQERGAEAAGAALDPVLATLPVGKAEYPLDFIRQKWSEWKGQLVWRDDGARWYSPAARLTNWLAHRWVNAQTTVVKQTLNELEAFGEKAISVASLKRFVVHRSAAVMAETTRSHVRFWTFVTAAVVFLLLVTPVALTTTFSILNANSH